MCRHVIFMRNAKIYLPYVMSRDTFNASVLIAVVFIVVEGLLIVIQETVQFGNDV